MSTMNDVGTSKFLRQIPNEKLSSKYEKCRNITEEIYKRINITFQIKKLETGSQSDVSNQSDHIDSNELSNGTDLFAYEKSDSISSSVSELDVSKCKLAGKYININNNEELRIKKSLTPIYKRPKKRFRKRVKKRKLRVHHNTDSEASTDEAAPLSRIIDPDSLKLIKDLEGDDSKSESLDNVMGVPKITILTSHFGGETRCYIKDVKNKQKKESKQETVERESHIGTKVPKAACASEMEVCSTNLVVKKCNLCHFTVRSERGLRRHILKEHGYNKSERFVQQFNVQESSTRPF